VYEWMLYCRMAGLGKAPVGEFCQNHRFGPTPHPPPPPGGGGVT